MIRDRTRENKSTDPPEIAAWAAALNRTLPISLVSFSFTFLPAAYCAVTEYSLQLAYLEHSGYRRSWFPPGGLLPSLLVYYVLLRTRGVPTSRGAHTCAAPSTTDGVRGLEASHYGPSAPREQSASDNHARPTIARPWPATNYSDRRRGANYPSARWASCQRGARFAPRAVARAAAGLGPTGLEPRRIPRSARLLQQARDARQAHGRPVQAGSCGARGQQQAELEHEPPTTSSSRDEHVPADQVDRPLAGRVARAGSRWHRDRHAGNRQSHVVPLLLADGH